MAGVALITGSGRGIGAATAILAAKRGYAVCVNYLKNAERAEAVVAEIRAGGGKAILVKADTANENEVVRLFERVDAELGPLTALVNNAGVVDVPARLDEMSFERLSRMFAINVLGSMLCAREAVRRMSMRHGGWPWSAAGGHQGGAIVNLSSAAARLGAAGQYIDYAAAKGAIDSFTLGLAREVAGEGIRVNAVRPGIIETAIHASGGQPDRAAQMAPQVPLRRAGSAAEAAQAILWLLSEASSYTTGAVIDVTGGR